MCICISAHLFIYTIVTNVGVCKFYSYAYSTNPGYPEEQDLCPRSGLKVTVPRA